MIHVIGDFIQSIGVFIAAIVIKFYVSSFIFQFNFIDVSFGGPEVINSGYSG